LLKFGADPARKDSSGRSALLEAFGVPDSQGKWFHDATPMIKLMLQAKPNPNGQDSRGMTPLMWASSLDESQAVKALLDAGADPEIRDLQGQTALDQAVSPEVRGLLKGADKKMNPVP
jgi:ankyrin repeat protein